MGFLNQFSTYFDSQEKETELYALWSAIGVNMEKAILEEQNKINAEFTDINNFSEDTMRSWLAFFLQRIPYRTSATSQVTVSLASENAKITRIPKYDQLSTDDGVVYTLYESLSLMYGDKRTVTAVQGKRVTETGTYNSIIKVQANNPDLSYIEVYLNGVEVPPVSYETSYDQLLYLGSWKPQSEEDKEWGGTPFIQNNFGKKGQFYNVIADGYTRFEEDGIPVEFRSGDIVVYDGNTWQKSFRTNGLQPIQFTNSYAVPRNGYFAYYYNNYLYIKIFAGTEVTNPNGQNYEVDYIQSDGIQGQIEANTLSFVSSYEDIDENPVELEVTNTKSSAAVNEPSVGKLGLYLKQRLYSSINVSSVPEYTAWFNAQPEVGDCMVLSDYEKYVRAGKPDFFSPTGIVDIFLVGTDGKPLSKELQEELLDRIEPFKDIAVLHISEFERVKQYLRFEYSTSTNENSFEQFVQATAAQYYNLNYLQSKNSSIFDDLDLASIIEDIQQNSPYASTGLIVKGYHYKEETVNSRQMSFESYSNERPGRGWYELVCDEGTENEKTYRFEEIESAGTITSCAIYGEKNVSTPVGTHVDTNVSIDLSDYEFSEAVLKCYWGMENEGILSIGAENGLRELADIAVVKVSS